MAGSQYDGAVAVFAFVRIPRQDAAPPAAHGPATALLRR